MVDYAMRAFIALMLSHGDVNVPNRALSLYGEAVRELSAVIQMRSVHDEPFLLTVLLLSSFDVCFLSFYLLMLALLRTH